MLKVPFYEKPFITCSLYNMIGHSELHMHAACENALLLTIACISN